MHRVRRGSRGRPRLLRLGRGGALAGWLLWSLGGTLLPVVHSLDHRNDHSHGPLDTAPGLRIVPEPQPAATGDAEPQPRTSGHRHEDGAAGHGHHHHGHTHHHTHAAPPGPEPTPRDALPEPLPTAAAASAHDVGPAAPPTHGHGSILHSSASLLEEETFPGPAAGPLVGPGPEPPVVGAARHAPRAAAARGPPPSPLA